MIFFNFFLCWTCTVSISTFVESVLNFWRVLEHDLSARWCSSDSLAPHTQRYQSRYNFSFAEISLIQTPLLKPGVNRRSRPWFGILMSCGNWSMSKDENMHSLILWKVSHPVTVISRAAVFQRVFIPYCLVSLCSLSLEFWGTSGGLVRDLLWTRLQFVCNNMCMLEVRKCDWNVKAMCCYLSREIHQQG